MKKNIQEIKKEILFSKLNSLRGKVLEIGFGDASSFNFYDINTHVTALDLSVKNIRRARKEKLPNITLVKADATYIPEKQNKFDAVVVSYSLCSVENHSNVINEISRVLKPNGVLLVLEHVPSDNKIILSLQKSFSKAHAYLFNNCKLHINPINDLKSLNFRYIDTQYLEAKRNRILFFCGTNNVSMFKNLIKQ